MEVKKSEINDQQMSNDVGIITGQFDKSIENNNNSSNINSNNDKALENIQNASSTCPNKETTNDVDNDHQDDTTESIDKLNSVAGAQSPTALAFTIDFSDEKKDKNDKAKYQNLFQRYNARHRRNFSTSQLEVKNSKSSNDLSPNFIQKKKPMSINSEGYFSSEDDTKRKVDRLSQKLQELGLKTNTKGAIKKTDIMTRSLTENKSIIKRRSYCDDDDDDDEEEQQQQQKTSNKLRPEMTYSATMNDLSRIQKLNLNIEDNERSNCVEYSPEKIYTKNIEYININHEYNNDKIIQNVKLSNINYLSDNDNDDNSIKKKIKKKKHTQIMSVSFTSEHVSNSSTSNKDMSNTNLDIFNVSNIDDNSDDTISETGTYTVHKDYTDEEKARMDIDKEFSVGILTEEEKKNNELYINNKFKMGYTHDNNTWIKEWATQVAVHNLVPTNDGRTTPISPTKIPSPIYSNSRRQSKSRYEQSDSSLDADIQQKCGLNNSNNNMIDSGGESDDDTSNSYPTPPLSSQRTSTHSTLVRRGSLTEALFKRVNNNDGRRSMRKYQDEISFDIPKSPSHVLARMKVERCNSLDRKDIYSDTQESNSSRRSSIRNDDNNISKHTNSPILNRLKLTTSKLTNNTIFDHKKITKNIIKSPSFDCQKKFTNYDNNKSKNNIDKSSYILRKSNSTSNYREIINDKNDYYHHHHYQINNSPLLQRNNSIKRSSSNNSIRNTKGLSRCDSFNDNHCEINRKMKNKISGSDSSSETGEIHRHHHQQKQQHHYQQQQQQQQQQQPHVPPISSGIKLNRAFSIRRGRLNNDSDTTSNTTTPEERRRRGQSEIKSAPTSARQQNYHHRERTNSVGASNKDTFKKSDVLLSKDKQRGPSLSRNEGGRYSMRGQKLNNNINNNTNNIQSRINQKINKDNKNCGRSNSTLTSKEVEFQNWKRRKNYNPMLAASEGKKKTIDSTKKNIDDTTNDCRDNSVLRSASFHGTRGTLSLADDWSDNDNNYDDSNEVLQIPPPSSPLDGSDSDLDTSSYLQTTHNVVTAMSARMNVYHSTEPVDSGGESDDDTSHSLRNNNNKIHNQVSDTESSDDQQAINSKNLTKFNRSFVGTRRGRETRDTDIKIPQIKNQHNLSNINNNNRTIARTDSGRFSMRTSKTNNSVNNAKGKTKEDKKKLMQQHLKEQEMQNWKRRKSYNPMQAAMMDAKRKTNIAKKNLTESSSVLRSQSFHGPMNLGISEWSDEDISASADEAPIY